MVLVTDAAALSKAIDEFCSDEEVSLDQVKVNPVLEQCGLNDLVAAALKSKFATNWQNVDRVDLERQKAMGDAIRSALPAHPDSFPAGFGPG